MGSIIGEQRLTRWLESPVVAGLPPHNLPAGLTSLVGREDERQKIHHLLRDGRLVTLTGLGGVGKTCLALQVAWDSLPYFCDGVYFAPLAAASSPDSLAASIVETLQFSLYDQADPKLQLFDYLRAKELLLVLDNFEHMVPAAGMLVELIQQAPGVRILATSRERLRLYGESLFEVKGLCVPPETSDKIENWGAVQLFLQSVRRVCPNFSITDQNRPHVIRICQLVDGLPLAIEMAAALARAWSCQEIACQIENGLDFLVSSWQDLPERHRSVRAVFEHSWHALTAQEQQVFSRLATFGGGAKRAKAQCVADATPDVLTSLVDKSLLRWNPSSERYEMHELLKQYAAEKLAQTRGEEEKTRDKHCECFLAFLHEQGQALKGREQLAALRLISAEIENIRRAWDWAAERAKVNLIEQCLDDLARFYSMRGWLQEGEAAFARAAKGLGAPTASPIACKLMARQSLFAGRLGQHELAVAQLRQSLAVFQAWGDLPEMAFCLLSLAGMAIHQTDYPRAKELLGQALILSKALDSRQVEANALRNLGNICWREGDYAQAQAYYEQSLRIYRELGDRWGEGGALNNLGIVLSLIGDYARSRTCHEQTMQIYREMGDRHGEAMSLVNMGLLSRYMGDFKAVQEYSRQAWQIAQELGDRLNEGYALTNLGCALVDLGQLEEAADVCQRAVALLRALGMHRLSMESLVGLARISMARGDLAQAQAQVEEILEYLESNTLDSTGEPFRGYLVCYQVLCANKDPRAVSILSAAYRLLQERAAQIGDEKARRMFLEKVAAHCQIVSEFKKRARTRPKASDSDALPPVESLSQRELEVLRLVAAGLSNQEIAHELCISLNTIKTHTKNIYSKLGARSRIQAVRQAKELGLL